MAWFSRLSYLPAAGLVGLSSIGYAAPVALASSSATVPAAECVSRFVHSRPPL
jgi:hypothetical protein